MALTDLAIRKLIPRDRPYMVRDSKGLYLEIVPSGGRLWRVRVWRDGRETKRSLGAYPDISLREARQARDAIRVALARGEDPLGAPGAGRPRSFRDVAEEWLAKHILPVRATKTIENASRRLRAHIYPWIGHRPVAEIAAPELLAMVRTIEKEFPAEAHRVLQIAGRVLRYAVASGLASRDCSGDLRGALATPAVRHHPFVSDPVRIGELMRGIHAMQGPVPRGALKLSAYTVCRPGEIRCAEWAEFDPVRLEWRIPAERMKARRPHLVPLSRQALAALEELRPLTGGGRFVFPSSRRAETPIANGTVLLALRALGFSRDELTPHGFRSMASTVLNESGLWSPDAIERQLAHVPGGVRAVYNYAQYLDERRRMIQWWADWLDERE